MLTMLGAGVGRRFPPIWTDGVHGGGEAKSRWSQPLRWERAAFFSQVCHFRVQLGS